MLFGGKGGTGKTTSACATALHFAQEKRGEKTLIVSTDPAHSVGDSFDQEVGETITPVKGIANLWALEIKAEQEEEEFNRVHKAVLEKIADRGTYFDRQDIEAFLSLTIPGLDEVMAVIRITKILKEGQFDFIIIDTAPTGHTVRLLALPSEMERWVGLLDLMQSKHRFLARHFAGRYKKDDADEFLEMMTQDLRRLKGLLSNAERTEFVPVTIPEPMSINETERLLARLRSFRMAADDLIVNRVASRRQGCPFCSVKREAQQEALSQIEQKFSDRRLWKMPLFPYEIRGKERLQEFADVLFGKADYKHEAAPRVFSVSLPGLTTRGAGLISQLLKQERQVILFGGKGGVGKTSVTCATALRVARMFPKKKVLAFSTDPAHSLSDSFGCPIGDRVTPIKGQDNLLALEIDAPKLLEARRKSQRREIEDTFNQILGRGVDIKFDREIMTELVSLTPPGLDEIMALGELTEFIQEGRFDLYVVDTAATGHLLRFLELPQLTRDWLRMTFQLLIKYQGVVRMTKVAEELVDFSKRVRKIQQMLTDVHKTEFVAITIPEAMGLAEARRLVKRLGDLKIACHHLVVNMVMPKTPCGFCAQKRKEQQRYLADLQRSQENGYHVSEIPLFPHKIDGLKPLTALADVMFGR